MSGRRTGFTSDVPSPQPLAWRWLLVLGIGHLAVHLATAGRYGIFRDEYYYLACASHLDWGYVDQPPLSIWILRGWTAMFGDSLLAIRILPAVTGLLSIFITGAVVAEMGGRRFAQALAGLAVGVGAVGLVLSGFYSMNAFDFMLWIAAYLYVVRIARTGDGRWWLPLGLLLGIGLLNKVGLLVFMAALATGVLLTRNRWHLLDRRFWAAGALCLVFLVPYVLWNRAHDWATLEFIRTAKAEKISAIAPLDFLAEVALEANPATVVIWGVGLLWLLVLSGGRRFRIVGLMFLVTFAVLILQKSKPYYLAGSFPVLQAAGAVAWETWTGRAPWARWLLTGFILAGGVVVAPLSLPLLSPERLTAYQQRLGIVPNTGEVGHTSAIPQYFSDRFGWPELATTVSDIYRNLPERDRTACAVVTTNYGEAGALDYWSDTLPLPPIHSIHNNYWLWGPPSPGTRIFLMVGFRRESVERIFGQVEFAGESTHPAALQSRIPVWICRDPTPSIPDLWNRVKTYI